LSISFELDEISDPDIKKKVETVIQGCIGPRPDEEVWKISIENLAGCWSVILKAPIQTRKRLFFEEACELPRKIREWLESYPLR